MIRARTRPHEADQQKFQEWFNSEAYFSRCLKGVLHGSAAYAVSFVILCFLLSLFNFSLLHPVDGIFGILSTLISWRVYLFSLLCAILCAGFASIVAAKWITLKPRDSLFRNPWTLLWLSLQGIVDLTQKLAFTLYALDAVQSPYSSETVNYKLGRRLIFFAVLLSSILNLAKNSQAKEWLIKFPSTSSPVLQTLWKSRHELLPRSIKSSLLQLGLSIVLYLFIGNGVMNAFSGEPSWPGPLSQLWAFLDIYLILTVFSLLFFQIIANSALQIILNSAVTQPMAFEVPVLELLNPMEEQKVPNLPVALEISEPILLKYLAFRDLSSLAQNSRERRSHIFSVSRPGGHPWNWIAIWESCGSVLFSCVHDLKLRNAKLASDWESLIDAKPSTASQPGTLDRTILLQPRRLRNNAAGFGGGGEKGVSQVETPPKLPLKEAASYQYLKAAIQKLLPHFIRKQPDWTPKDPELVLWTIEEDEFGVVQRSLSDIIALLVDLYVESDRNCRLSGTGRSELRKTGPSEEICLIKHAVEIGLLAIKEKFAPHIATDIKLSSEHLAYLNSIQDKGSTIVN